MNILQTGLLAMAAAHGALAATPQTSTIEFFHTGLQHYFVTADALESLAVGNGAAGDGWVRTGRSFGVWSDDSAPPAGVVPVCRFYSSGAHAHFYTADAAECAQLRGLQSDQSAAAAAAQQPFAGWAFEGNAFLAQIPANGQCPAATEAVYRFYNDGAASGTGSSHRFVTDAEMSALMQSRGWTAEGVAFCSPVTASGTSAPATPTTGTFPEIAATWTGSGQWEFEVRPHGSEARITAPVTLTLAADGRLSGSGNGCTLGGSIAAADGFHSLYRGTVTTTGCADAHFAGSFPLRLERYGAALLSLQFGVATSALKVEVEAALSTSDTTPPPPPPPPSGTVAAGTWTGDALWVAAQQQNGNMTTLVSVRNPLSLAVAANGGLSGTGFGCTFAGSLTAVAGGVTGNVSATGCTDARFSGSYAGIGIHFENGSAIEVEFERESEQGGGTQLRIEINGLLAAGSGGSTPPPPPPPPAVSFALTGTWSSAQAQWTDERRVSGVTTTAQSAHALALTIAAGGAVIGSGFGCQFSGFLQPVAGTTTAFTGSITASGCTNADFNGTYANFTAQAEDNAALQVEMERESEGGGLRVKASIDATLARQ